MSYKNDYGFITFLVFILFAYSNIYWYNASKNYKSEIIDLHMRIIEKDLECNSEMDKYRYIHNLVDTFGLEEKVVKYILTKSKEYVNLDGDWDTWKFIQTPEFLAFQFCSIIKVESNGNPKAVSRVGAIGLTQLLPSTARDYEDVKRNDLFNPYKNIDIAFQHYVFLLKQYNGNPHRVAISWNRGHNRVDKLIASGLSPTNGYVKRVVLAELLEGN